MLEENNEIFEEKLDTEKQESDEQPDTTDTTNMPELESEESAGQNKR